MITCLAAAVLATALNVTYSPDSTKIAYSRNGDLYYMSLPDSCETRISDDGGDGILNGRASWVYYEEIFGRSSDYKAFWWSPDSKKIAYYRFDESKVGVFPIFSEEGFYGSLNLTKYPKAGTENPSVEIFIANLEGASPASTMVMETDSLWEYFGTPFWGSDSKKLFVQRMPRRQNRVELVSVDNESGKTETIYKEEYPTWTEWIEGMLFGKDGLYMARGFESGWEQIYYLSYDGSVFKRLSDGENSAVQLLDVDEKKGVLRFVAYRGSKIHPAVYELRRSGKIKALTDENLYARNVNIEPDGTLSMTLSNARTDYDGNLHEELPSPQIVTIENDGYTLYGLICFPKDFDPGKRYPIVMEVYGGPGTRYVRDYWKSRDASNQWCWENGIIWMVVDPRSAGENGRKGMDEAFGKMTVVELDDYIAWAEYVGNLPYVCKDRIGVDGFSFGGTTTAMLVLRFPEFFRCGIAGGGVYDWALYDSHYTERYMDTPQNNPEGYRNASVLYFVENDLVSKDYRPYSLKITHGTADDNVHFQNSLQLISALQRKGILFETMIYPGGKHGYKGLQHDFDILDAAAFWKKNLLDE